MTLGRLNCLDLLARLTSSPRRPQLRAGVGAGAAVLLQQERGRLPIIGRLFWARSTCSANYSHSARQSVSARIYTSNNLQLGSLLNDMTMNVGLRSVYPALSWYEILSDDQRRYKAMSSPLVKGQSDLKFQFFLRSSALLIRWHLSLTPHSRLPQYRIQFLLLLLPLLQRRRPTLSSAYAL